MKKLINKIKAIIFGQNRAPENLNQVLPLSAAHGFSNAEQASKENELSKKTTKNASNKGSEMRKSFRINHLKDIDKCLYILTSAYGEDKETENIYKICVEYLKKTKETSTRSIDFVELSNFNGNLVVAICGNWDNNKGVGLPWQELPRCDCWVNTGGTDTYKSTYLMNSQEIKSSNI